MWQKPVLHTKEQGCISSGETHLNIPLSLPSALSTLPPPSCLSKALPISKGATSTVLQKKLGKRSHGVQGFGDSTSPVSGCPAEEPEVGKRKKSQWLGDKEAWESHSYSDKRDRSSVSRLQVCMCVPAYPAGLSISFCNSLLSRCLVPMCTSKTWSQTTGHKGWWVSGASKAGRELLQVQVQSHGVPSWTGQQTGRVALGLGRDTLAEWGSWGSWLLQEQRGVQGELLENLWCLGLAAVHVFKRQWGINRPKSSRVEWMTKPSNWKDL